MNTAVKIVFLICATIMSIAFLATAILAPIYATPGLYYWTVFSMICLFGIAETVINTVKSWG